MQSIKISVIVPVYNSEKFLKKCIESILNQSLKEIEVIIVNDGSTDNSLNILKNFNDERIIIINKKNQGVSSARNDGLKRSKGQYILMIDSDDYIEQNYFEKIYLKAKNDKLDIVVTDMNIIKKNKKKYIRDLNIDEKIILSGEEYLELFFKKNFFGFNCNKLIKRELFIKNKIIYNSKIMMMEDVLVLIQLLLNSKRIGKINKAYYNYIQHTSNTTKTLSKEHLKSVQLMEKQAIKFLTNKRNITELLKTRILYIKFEYTIAISDLSIEDFKDLIQNLEIKVNKTVDFSRKTKLLINILKYTQNKNYCIKLFRKIYKIYRR